MTTENILTHVMPRFCFICGTKLMEVGSSWLQCDSEQCGEVFLPFIDKNNNNQCLMHQRTPFSHNVQRNTKIK